MKKIFIVLTLFCALAACKNNTVDFSVSPEAPRAGQSVLFSNLSTSGEEWEWIFGDGAVSALKSPSHIYKKPGEYVVTLKIDKRASWTKTTRLTVYDTIPTFTASDTVFYIYSDYTFTANVYNPYNYTLSCLWGLPDADESEPYAFPVVSEDYEGDPLSGSPKTFCFTRPKEDAAIELWLVLNGDTTHIVQSFRVQDRPAKSVLMRRENGDNYRQRIFGERAEKMRRDASAAPLLDAEQDSLQTYNGKTFRLSELQQVFPAMQGFRIANRKIYYRLADPDMNLSGLWVANIDGTNPVAIDSLRECRAMTIDTEDNRIYWASDTCVWYMPLVGSDNNRFVTTPSILNGEGASVTRLAIDYEAK